MYKENLIFKWIIMQGKSSYNDNDHHHHHHNNFNKCALFISLLEEEKTTYIINMFNYKYVFLNYFILFISNFKTILIGKMSKHETRIIYYKDTEVDKMPYMIKLSIAPDKVTLRDFKQALNVNVKQFKFFFKQVVEDFG